ncbi:YktB family protein [Virgibacillus halodenitrificans]|uniref:YktB family protein n=1 Tax=Virgibacillus halodenitrificans TaxID=1482 RepID=UPI0007618028
MNFDGFNQHDFDTFSINGLDERMEAIQSRIQPKFQELGSYMVDYLSAQLGNEVYLHIAKHARRTVNPPKDTWLAIADNKRGYKKHPHFQIGLFDDHVFIWLALIYELDHKKEIAQTFLDNYQTLEKLPDYYRISLDHTKKTSISLKQLEKKDVERFRDVKKAEFLIGQHLPSTDLRVKNGDKFIITVKDTFNSLIPFYQMALRSK